MVNRTRATLFDLTLIAICAALLAGGQIAMASLPNIEPVSVLTVCFSRRLGWRTPIILALFTLLEGLIFGFGVWWFCYLYVWQLLYLLTRLLRRMEGRLFWASVLGGYGLLFGTLCSVPYFFLAGPAGGLSWIISGLPFDLLHGAGNFALGLVLLAPLDRVLQKLMAGRPDCRPCYAEREKEGKTKPFFS